MSANRVRDEGRRLIGFVLAGLAQAAAVAWPGSGQPVWWLQISSLAALVLLLGARGHRSALLGWRRAFWSGWAFSTSWLCGTFWWLFVSLHTYGGLAAPLAVIAVLALAAGLGLYYAVACAAFVRLAPERMLGRALVFAAAWTLAELVRGSWFTGFPWGAGGYAHVDGPLALFAALAGVYGVGAVAALFAALAAQSIASLRAPMRRRDWAMPVMLGLALMAAGAGSRCVTGGCSLPAATAAATDEHATGRLDVALLQGNIPQDQKFVPGGGIPVALDWYARELLNATASLVVTPETALPLLPAQLPPGYLETIAARYTGPSSNAGAGSRGQAAIVGLPLGGGGTDYSNSVLGFRPGAAQPYRYDKHHLVPFGEFVPGLFRWFTDLMRIPLGDFRRGGLAQPGFAWQGQRIAPNICYEDLFGDEIGAGFRDAASAPTILLNVSNIAWFGDTVAIDGHLTISRMRALEFRRPMVRATNTGATVVIDHFGRVTHSLPRLTRGVLLASVEGRDELTPFAWWVSRFGLWPLWGSAMAVLLAAVAARIGRDRRRPVA